MSRRLDVWHLLVGLDRGGAEKLLATVLPRMREHGIRCRVLALKGRGPVAAELEAADIPVEVLGGTGRADPRPVWRLVRRLREARPDVLHAHLSRAILAASWSCRLTATPLIAHFHSLAGTRPAWQDRLESRACRGARIRVAVSRAVAEERASRLGVSSDLFTVVPNAVDAGAYAGLPAPERRGGRPLRVGFLGRLLEKTKGLDLLLDTAARLADDRVARFEIAGGPASAAERLRQRVAEAGLDARVRVLGEVPEARQVLGEWDVVMLPSRHEGFGMVLLEAMAAARPVIATRVGGIPEVVEDGRTGLLVAGGSVDELARAVEELARDPARAADLGRAGRRRARQCFDVEAIAGTWAALARAAAGVRGAA